MTIRLMIGDSLTQLKTLPDQSANCCITSPPYWGLREYGTAKWEGGDPDCDHSYFKGGKGGASAKQVTSAGTQKYQHAGTCPKCGATRTDSQMGQESTPEQFVLNLVSLLREVRRVLRDDGTLWLNLGDSYATGTKAPRQKGDSLLGDSTSDARTQPRVGTPAGLKTKDLVGIPWMVAFALRADGWYLRQDIIWAKPNPMPESVKDRCTKSHEHIFLLSKSPRYYYDAAAIAEPVKESSLVRAKDGVKFGGTNPCPDTRLQSGKEWNPTQGGGGRGFKGHSGNMLADGTTYTTKNKRDVWFVTTKGYKKAHFATFPTKLIEPCVLAGCPEGGVVLDPFCGSGTTGLVALTHNRSFIGIELNPEYMKLTEERLEEMTGGLLAPLYTREVPVSKKPTKTRKDNPKVRVVAIQTDFAGAEEVIERPTVLDLFGEEAK